MNLQATVQLSSTTGRVANSNLKLPGAGPWEYRGPRSSLLVMSGAALPQCQKLEEKRVYRSLPLEVPLCCALTRLKLPARTHSDLCQWGT